MASDWRQQLAELLAGPYAGRGGIGALAEAVGVHPKTVQHWGTGRYSPLVAAPAGYRAALAGHGGGGAAAGGGERPMSEHKVDVTVNVTVAPDGPLNFPFGSVTVEASRDVMKGAPNLWIEAHGEVRRNGAHWTLMAIVLSREDAESLACVMLAACAEQRQAEKPEQWEVTSTWPKVKLEALVDGRWKEM